MRPAVQCVATFGIMSLQALGGGSMVRVGIRELKSKLSRYLRRVEEGERIEVTNRGKVIAFLIPAKGQGVDNAAWRLVEEGLASWSGGKPQGSRNPVKGRGRLVSEIIVEDRG